MTAWFDRLSVGWQAALTLGGALSVGAGFGLALAGWVKLPDKVESQGDAIVEIRADVSELQRAQRADSLQLVKIECYVKAIALKRNPLGCPL